MAALLEDGEWTLTEATYTGDAQRLSATPNRVLQLNLDLNLFDDPSRTVLEALRKLAVASGHPVRLTGRAWTVGWVRYSFIGDTMLVEEIQTDLETVRRQLTSEEFLKLFDGIDAERVEKALKLVEPWSAHFYSEAMRQAFVLASDHDKRLELLSWEQKKHCQAPKSVYTDLPRRFGMKRTLGTFPEIGKVWVLPVSTNSKE